MTLPKGTSVAVNATEVPLVRSPGAFFAAETGAHARERLGDGLTAAVPVDWVHD
ncbi:hypothetical protein [Prauserella flavalba]|uniref:hypothetical protein n=1 Tax=Prauserella flavalba TaxID=1477506 RepID=UPI0036E72E62